MTTPNPPEGQAPAASNGPPASNVFMRKLGPLPMWAWMAVGLAIGLGYYFWKKNQAASATTATASTAAAGTNTSDSNLIPQFVNQVYTDNVPPEQGPAGPAGATGATGATGPAGPAAPAPPPENLTRMWESEGGSTLAAVMGRLGTKVLTPSNAAAKNWYNNVYKKNKNAKMPKGLIFTYTEGTVTPKAAA